MNKEKEEYNFLPDNVTGAKALMKNGKPMLCPFQQALVVEGQIAGQYAIQRMSCNDLCPLMTATKTERGYSVLIQCGCDNKHITVTDKTPNNLIVR